MRLLHKTTYEIANFFDTDTPPYIILSHRWSGTETSLQELLAQRHLPPSEHSAGTAKALKLCQEVQSYDAEYVWVDTCCIDKSSSAELQEAINSMYKWYSKAELCIVYVSDVDSSKGESVQEQLEQSAWFTRGWTLQELLAPVNQIFVDRDWRPLGSRQELSAIIHSITGIKPGFYGNLTAIRKASVAERMSWLSLRRTSRIEDMAYCMLGIFDVNITMLYGEGDKAFQRLQKEIVHMIDDESIFVWQPTLISEKEKSIVTVLAPEPACFAVCRNRSIETSMYFHREPHRWTTKGLELELFGERFVQFSSQGVLVILNCTMDGKRVAFEILKSERGLHLGGNVWNRIQDPDVRLLEENTYARVPTSHDSFRMKSQDLAREAHQKVFNQNQLPMHHTAFTEIMDYEREKIRFKVFIE